MKNNIVGLHSPLLLRNGYSMHHHSMALVQFFPLLSSVIKYLTINGTDLYGVFTKGIFKNCICIL